MNKQTVVSANFVRYLSYRLKERLTFDIAYRTADFSHNHVCVGFFAYAVDKFFYLIGYMRDNLHGFAEIVASAFFVEYVPIYLTRGKIGKLVELNIYKSLVVSQIKVGFCAVLRNVDFAVLKGVHSARVNVDVRV